MDMQCDKCDMKFGTQEELDQHTADVHAEEPAADDAVDGDDAAATPVVPAADAVDGVENPEEEKEAPAAM